MAHCFYDAPHVIKHLFLDFYDWLDFLGKVSNQTNYNWFIKSHPHTLNPYLSNKAFKDLLKKYPKFNIIDSKITTGEIISNADLILTIYGTVGFEFAYFKKKVILGSPYSQYKNYNFCLQPKNKKKYLYLIKNFDKIKVKFDKKEIYRFYFNNVLSYTNPLNLLSERKNLNKDFFNPRIFKSLIDKFDEKKHILFSDNCNKFIESKKFRFTDF
jgi:CDP-glycerol glycerophosphotransferase (TagB/SpsB family)